MRSIRTALLLTGLILLAPLAAHAQQGASGQAPVPPPPPAPPAPPLPPAPPAEGGFFVGGQARIERVDEPLAFGSKLWVRNRNGAIRVTGWDKEQVDLVAEIRDTEKRKVTLVVQRKGNDLDIEAQTSQPTFSFGFTVTPRCELILQVPRKLLGHFRTINGAVTLRQLDGYARLETTNGTITAEDVSGEVHADTTNGNVELRRLKARAKAETTNGKISLEQVDGGVQADTTNGSIRARGLDGWNEGIRFETTNGSIDVELGRATGELIAENSNGRIDAEVKGATVVESSKHSLRLKIPGRTQKISLETTNGSITVR